MVSSAEMVPPIIITVIRNWFPYFIILEKWAQLCHLRLLESWEEVGLIHICHCHICPVYLSAPGVLFLSCKHAVHLLALNSWATSPGLSLGMPQSPFLFSYRVNKKEWDFVLRWCGPGLRQNEGLRVCSLPWSLIFLAVPFLESDGKAVLSSRVSREGWSRFPSWNRLIF